MLGEILKKTRLSQGIKLEKVASDLKIRVTNLKALEEEDFEIFPAEVYTMGYIRAYALYLGLDPEPLIKEFKDRMATITSATEKAEEIAEGIKEKIEDKKSVTGTFAANPSKIIQQSRPSFMASLLKPTAIISTVIILLLGIIIFSIFKTTRTNVKLDIPPPPEVTSKQSPVTSKPLDATISSELSEKEGFKSSTPTSSPEIRGQKTPTVTSTTEKTEGEKNYAFNLKIVATELTWLKVDTSEGSHDITMKPGEVTQYRSEKDFKLLIGNAGGIRLILNGKDLGSPGKSGEVKIVTLP
jgi:cytoskeleton protein RodZ